MCVCVSVSVYLCAVCSYPAQFICVKAFENIHIMFSTDKVMHKVMHINFHYTQLIPLSINYLGKICISKQYLKAHCILFFNFYSQYFQVRHQSFEK